MGQRHGNRMKSVPLLAMGARHEVTHSRVLFAQVLGVTSPEGFLITSLIQFSAS